MSGLGENLVGCAALLEHVRNGVNELTTMCEPGEIPIAYGVGSLILISTIPHIYYKRDSEEVIKMKIEINKKKMLKQWKVKIIRDE
jgi:hypothetical protein